MTITITDTAHNRSTLKVPGNATIAQVCDLYRAKWNLPIWDEVSIARSDKGVFWVEDKGEYSVTVRYNPDPDTRPECDIRIETATEFRVYLIQHYRPATEDPMAIWVDICLKYGFVNPGRNFLEISGHPTCHLATYKYKIPTSLNRVAIPALSKRFFRILITDDDVWDTGEVLSVESWTKDRIWAQLTELRPGLPHYSQFLFRHSTGEISQLSTTLPLGPIAVCRLKFPVTWRVELFPNDIIQNDMHSGFSVQEAWAALRTQIPRLFENATLNYSGFLQPGAIIQVEAMRADITTTVNFEVKDKGWIECPGFTFGNMTERRVICDFFKDLDPRLPPLAE
jgi:hypothetical protein